MSFFKKKHQKKKKNTFLGIDREKEYEESRLERKKMAEKSINSRKTLSVKDGNDLNAPKNFIDERSIGLATDWMAGHDISHDEAEALQNYHKIIQQIPTRRDFVKGTINAAIANNFIKGLIELSLISDVLLSEESIEMMTPKETQGAYQTVIKALQFLEPYVFPTEEAKNDAIVNTTINLGLNQADVHDKLIAEASPRVREVMRRAMAKAEVRAKKILEDQKDD